MRNRPREKLVKRNTLTADQQRALRSECVGKRRGSGRCPTRLAALDLNRNDAASRACDKVDLGTALPPVEQLAFATGGRVGQVCANRGFDQSTTVLGIGTNLCNPRTIPAPASSSR